MIDTPDTPPVMVVNGANGSEKRTEKKVFRFSLIFILFVQGRRLPMGNDCSFLFPGEING